MRGRALAPGDITAPLPSSASVATNGVTYTIVFTESVKGFAAGANGFAITPSGGVATLTYVSGTGTNTIVFTISRPLDAAETLTASYTPGTITDLAGNLLAGFSGQPVTNNSTQDAVVPTVLTKVISSNGTTFTVGFSESVTAFTTGTNGFVVTPTGGASAISYTSGNGTSTIVFTLARTIASNETVTLAYTPGIITDLVGNALAGFSGTSVTNGSDQTKPAFSSANISSAGNVFSVIFSQGVTGHTGFTITPSGGATTLTYTSGETSNTLVFSTSRFILSGETVTVTYTPGNVVGSSGSIPADAFATQSVTNNSTETAPTVSTKTIQSTGTTLRVVFSASMSGFSSGAEGFALTGLTGGATTLTYSSGEGTATIDFTISRTILSSETSGVLAYTAGDIVKVTTGVALANFSGSAVTNSSAITRPTVSSTVIGTNGTTVTITCSQSVTGHTGFTITPSGSAATLTYTSGDPGTALVFTASRTITSSETATGAYTAGDVVGTTGGVTLSNYSGASVTNNSTQAAPTLSSATIQVGGTTLRCVFSVAVTGFSTGDEGFVMTGLTGVGGAATLSYSSGNNSTTVDFTISRTINRLETTPVLAYTAGDITGQSNGLALANFTGASITNNGAVGASVRAQSTGTMTAGGTIVTLPTRSAGDTLLCYMAFSVAVPTANTGWTRRFDQTSGGSVNHLTIYTRQSDGTDNTPVSGTVAANATYEIVSIKDVFVGYDTSGSGSGTSTSIVAPSITPGNNFAVLFNSYLRDSGTGTITLPGGQTTVGPANTAVLTHRSGYETLASPVPTGTRTATNSTSTGWAGGSATAL